MGELRECSSVGNSGFCKILDSGLDIDVILDSDSGAVVTCVGCRKIELILECIFCIKDITESLECAVGLWFAYPFLVSILVVVFSK